MKKCPIDGKTLLIFNEVRIKDGIICTHCRNAIGLLPSDSEYTQIRQNLTVAEVQQFIASNTTLDLQKIHTENEEKRKSEIIAQEEKRKAEAAEQKRQEQIAIKKEQETLDWMQNGDLTEVARETDKVILHKNEYLFYEVTGNVPWYEDRVHTERRGYSGMGVSFRVAKGVYIHSGRSYPMSRKYTQSEMIHSGEILLTNKRLILAGQNDSAQITLSSIVNITPYSDGITIQKSRGKDVTLGGFDGEDLAIFITRLASGDWSAHSSYVKPIESSKIPLDDFVNSLSQSLTVRQDKQQHFLDIVTAGDPAELKDIYINHYEDYNKTIENLINQAYTTVQSLNSKTDISQYTVRFYSDENFQNIIFQFKNGQMEYSLFTDIKFIDYLNNINTHEA